MHDRAAPRQSPLVRRIPGAELTILGPPRPLVSAVPATLAEAATTLWAAAGSRSRRRHFPPSRSRESGGGTCVLRSARGRGLRTRVLNCRADPGAELLAEGNHGVHLEQSLL